MWCENSLIHYVRLHGTLFIYRGNWTLLPWEIASVRVTGSSGDTFTMGNIHGYVKKRKETAHDIKLGKKLGFSIPKAEQPLGFFNMKPQKIAFLNSFLSHLPRERSMVTWQISWQNFELVCWNKFRNDISQKYVLFVVSNSGMQLNCKIELCTFAKLSWITYQLKFQL